MKETLFAKALDALPNPIVLYDRDLRIHHANVAALRMSAEHELGAAFLKKSGEAMRCVNARLGPTGCGSSDACKRCSVRNAVAESLATQTVVRQAARLEREAPWGTEVRHVRVLSSPFHYEGELMALVEFVDESELVELRRLLPVCSRCGATRGDDAYRTQIEDYLAAHPEAKEEALCDTCRAGLGAGALTQVV